MGHGHHHHGESMRDYFVEQLLTILVCGLFGIVAVLLYTSGGLDKLLAPQFHPWVLVGGIALLVMVVLRAVGVWKEAGQAQADQLHGPDCAPNCDHDLLGGDDPNQDHGHSHDLSWTFARMLVLAFPIALFFTGSMNANFSQGAMEKMLGQDKALGNAELKELAKDATELETKTLDDGSTVRVLRTKNKLKIRETTPKAGGSPRYELIPEAGVRMRFNDLNDAAYDQAKRESLEGQTAIIEGRFKQRGDKEFTLYRMKMTCCAADTVPLKVQILVPQALSGFNNYDWVQAKGQIQFLPVPGTNEYVPVIMVADITDVTRPPPKNEYES